MINEIKAETLLYKKVGSKFHCKICDYEFESKRKVEKHIIREHHDEVIKIILKEVLRRGERTSKEIKGFNILIDNMDVKKFKEIDVDLGTTEGIIRMINEVFFHGDWKKQIEWIKKYGSEEQKREDIPLIEELIMKNLKHY